MVLKELPSKASSEANALLTVTTKVGITQPTHRQDAPSLSWYGNAATLYMEGLGATCFVVKLSSFLEHIT